MTIYARTWFMQPIKEEVKTDSELLSFALENGMLDTARVREEIERVKKQKILSSHSYQIYEGKDGGWYTYLPDPEKKRRRIKRKTKKELEDAIVGHYVKEKSSENVADVFKEWNDHRLKIGRIANSTHMRNEELFRRYFDTKIQKKQIGSITPMDWEKFLEDQVIQYGLRRKAFNNLKTIVRGMMKRAKRRELIDMSVSDFFEDLDLDDCVKPNAKRPDSEVVVSETEFPILMDYLKSNPTLFNLGIILMMVTGLRVGELAALKLSDFESPSVLHVSRTETRYKGEDGRCVFAVADRTKTRAGDRRVVIPPEYQWLYRKLRNANPFGEYLFMEKTGNRASTESFRKKLAAVCRKAGIAKKSPHDLRRTYISLLLDNGIDQNFIIQQVGHTNIQCSEQFYHKDRKSIGTKERILDGVPEFSSAHFGGGSSKVLKCFP